VHWTLVALALPVSVIALSPRHTPLIARILAAGGLLLLIIAAAGWPTRSWETALSVTGALVLSLGHLLNARQAHLHGGGAAACP
jgi:hypothetical protein